MISKEKQEKQLENEYNILWSDAKKINRVDENLVLGWHFGYYEKGVKSHKKAFINMNDYVGRLLDINNGSLNILDAGCGVGGTVIYLAKKYPNSTFFGITLAPNEIVHAEKLKIKNNLKNIFFSKQSYYDTKFQAEFFDDIYALESFSYSKYEHLFLKEMNRILKKGGKIAIVDLFVKCDTTNPYIRTLKFKILKENEHKKSRITIYTFEKYLKQDGFENIKIYNLSKNKNIKYSQLYCFMIYHLFKDLYHQTREKMVQKKYNSIFLIWKFFNRFIVKTLILMFLKTDYYSITAVKK